MKLKQCVKEFYKNKGLSDFNEYLENSKCDNATNKKVIVTATGLEPTTT